MTHRLITDQSHCEHLLVVEGEPQDIRCFVENAIGPGSALSLSKLLPPPASLDEVDAVTLAHFHLMSGDCEAARAIYEELGEPWPLPQVDPSSRALREHLRANPQIALDARRVQLNLTRHGALDVRSWKHTHWGAAVDLTAPAIEAALAERVHYRFQDGSNRMCAMLAVARAYPRLTVGGIVADFRARAQSWFFKFADDNRIEQVSSDFTTQTSLVELFIDNPPEIFAHAG